MTIVKANNVTLPANAESDHVNHFTFNGVGQLSTNYYTSLNTNDNVQLGLQINHRGQGVNYIGSVSPDGDIHFNVNAGSQVGNPARAEWSFNYSIDNVANGRIDNHHYNLLIDLDPSVATNFLTLHSEVVGGTKAQPGPAHIVWADDNGNIRIGDDGQNPGDLHVTQNSQNLAFYLNDMAAAIPKDHVGETPYHYESGAQIDIVLQEVNLAGVPVQSVHAVVHVV